MELEFEPSSACLLILLKSLRETPPRWEQNDAGQNSHSAKQFSIQVTLQLPLICHNPSRAWIPWTLDTLSPNMDSENKPTPYPKLRLESPWLCVSVHVYGTGCHWNVKCLHMLPYAWIMGCFSVFHVNMPTDWHYLINEASGTMTWYTWCICLLNHQQPNLACNTHKPDTNITAVLDTVESFLRSVFDHYVFVALRMSCRTAFFSSIHCFDGSNKLVITLGKGWAKLWRC